MGSLQKKQELRTSLVSSARLTPQHSVHEVTWQGRRLLIGCAPQSIALLAEAPLDESAVQPGLSTNEGKDGTP
jgi:flagellar biogenesis protein FliO